MISQQLSILYAMLMRDWIVIKKELPSLFIDCTFLITTEIILFAHLLPRMGMPAHDGPALFIGSSCMIAMLVSNTHAQNLLFDLEFSKFIDYQITQPISLPLVMIKYIISMAFQAMLISLPLLTIGSFAFSTPLVSSTTNWPLVVAIYISACICTAIIYLFFSFHYSFTWYMDNIWARRISPIFAFGTLFLLWHKVYALSPFFALLFLLNPFTFMSEGMRSALLGNPVYIPAPICFVALWIFIIVIGFALLRAIKRKLDPV